MVQEQNEIIGRRLQDVRESAHMDFYDMAKLLRVSVGHYRKIERGVYGLDVEKLVILYEKLDVDPLYLLAGRQKARRESVDSHLAIRNRRVCELLEYCKQQLSDEVEEYRRQKFLFSQSQIRLKTGKQPNGIFNSYVSKVSRKQSIC